MISVIIPVYNVSDYITRCIDSVINQTYPHIECILIDDCSPDNSSKLIEERLQEYKQSIKSRLIKHEHNKGVAEARKAGKLCRLWIIQFDPLTSIIEVMRYGTIGVGTFTWLSFGYSVAVTLLSMLFGSWIFNKVERSFIDVI